MAFEVLTRDADRSRPADGTFRFGIEEEYFLADRATLNVACRTPEALFQTVSSHGGAVKREMLQAQLEVATRPHAESAAARRELEDLRGVAGTAAARYGLAILAAGTHPTAKWTEVSQTPKARYDEVMGGLQMIGRRNMVCGMHVHVELPDPARRVDIMTRISPYLPLLIALSTSSPFWQSQCTGLKGYRLAAYDELPRTGLPEAFSCGEEYDAYVDAMVRSGAIPDASHVWWSIRPSLNYPTLELRAADSCTRLDDALAVAALYRCLVRLLYRDPHINRDLRAVDRALALENKWRAQRYGVEAGFVTPAGAVSVAETLDHVIDAIEPDMDALGCIEEIYHCRTIVSAGSSADAQLGVFREHADRGSRAALGAVARWLADATLAA